MDSEQPDRFPRLIDAAADLRRAGAHVGSLHADASRLAYTDMEFLLRDETRGVRLQLELLKPELALRAAGIDRTVVVFGSARIRSRESAEAALVDAERSGDAEMVARAAAALRRSEYYEAARELGRMVSEWSLEQRPHRRLYVCTGGGPGVMEAANRGAFEAGLPSVALRIVLPFEEEVNPYTTPELTFTFHYFAMRKMHFMMRANALVAFPGGLGTLDELFEVLTLVQTRRSEPVPIVLFGRDHWSRLVDFGYLADEGLISPGDVDLVRFADTPAEAAAHIRDFYEGPPR